VIREACWIVLGREPSNEEAGALDAYRRSGGDALVIKHLLASPEFHLIFSGWRDDIGIGKDPVAHEAGLRSLGTNRHFVERCYAYLFGREADDAGLQHYTRVLEAGEARREVVRIFVTSDELEARYRPIAAQAGGGFVPRDVQLCELANPAKWDNPDWLRLLKSLVVVPHHKLAMHRKSYEWTQLLFGLSELRALTEDASVLSVGAGHEVPLYWLANHVGEVVATDLYEGRWQSSAAREGDASVLDDPDAFAPFPYRRDRLRFLRMDGRALDFPDGSFDVVFSLSSIEHFGGLDGASASMREMARVAKPDGLVVVATEYIVAGPDYAEAFQPDAFARLITVPGLAPVQPVDTRVYERYDCRPVNLRENPDQRPHMLVTVDGTTFTSAIVFLRKVAGAG